MPKALITGITGQTGSYLAEYLVNIGYEVHGIVRRLSLNNYGRLIGLLNPTPKIKLWDADLHDIASLVRVINNVKPDEVYNLAAQSFVPVSWDQPLLTADITGIGVLRVLEAIVQSKNTNIKFYQSSSSEMFGKVREEPQTELTPFHPRSPYGVAKAFGHHITVNYRESHGLFACSGIAYNHESPRRGLEFVTRKITYSVADIHHRISSGLPVVKLKLGNMDARRDWGFAGDYVMAMHLILQQSVPDDYIIATGEQHTVREFAKIAFDCVGLDMDEHTEIDQNLFRPAEVVTLLGDPTKIRKIGWEPTTSFYDLVSGMVKHDVEMVKCAN